MKRFYALFVICFALNCGFRVVNAQIRVPEPIPPPPAIRGAFNLDPFYQQWINVKGLPILASAEVSPYAVKEAAYLTHRVIGHRPDILRVMGENRERFSVIGYNERITQIPEYGYLAVPFYQDIRNRGLGSASPNFTTSASEENLLNYPGDPYHGFSVFLHEFAHALHNRGLRHVDPEFDGRLRDAYAAAMRIGLWKGTFATTNVDEYWAEGVEAWFNPKTTSSFNRFGDTRQELKDYDPTLAKLLIEVFGDKNWRYTPATTRTHQPHLKGFNPQASPTFEWPADVKALHTAFTTDPDSTGDGRWVNLKAHPPSELARLNASRNDGDIIDLGFIIYGSGEVFVYEITPDGTERLAFRLRDGVDVVHTQVGALWLLKDAEGKNLAVFRAESKTGRVFMGPGRLDESPEGKISVDESPEVKIPDPNLATAIRKELRMKASTPITENTLQRLTTFHGGENEIKDLTGLEHATGLTQLSLWENQIQDVTPLAGLTQLQQLHLQGNQIKDITPLAKLTKLRYLHLWGNQIQDIQVLAGFIKLESLWLENNRIRDVSPLAGLTKLTDLKLSGNPIQDGTPLRRLVARNPDLELDIEIPELSPVVQIGIGQRPSMYWTDIEAGTLHRLLGVGIKVENLLPSVRNARDLTVDVTGNTFYWTEKTSDTSGKIQRANLDGSRVQGVKDLTSVPLGIALDTRRDKLYLSNAWGKIQRIHVDGSNFQPNLITGLGSLQDFAIDVARGKLYWIEQTGEKTSKIQRADLDGKNIQLVKALTSASRGIALDTAKRKIYVTNAYGKIQRLNFDGSNFQPNFITGLESPQGIAVDAGGGKLYWTQKGSIRRASLNGDTLQNVVVGLDTPANLTLDILPANTAIAAAPATVRDVPDETALHPNYPNPFNPETWIPYQLATPADVTLTIYAVNGQVVRRLALGHQPAGMYQTHSRAVYWDGKNAHGEPVASGVYFYTLTAGDFTATRKLLIRK